MTASETKLDTIRRLLTPDRIRVERTPAGHRFSLVGLSARELTVVENAAREVYRCSIPEYLEMMIAERVERELPKLRKQIN